MLLCEQAMGLVRGKEIQELVEQATGERCPCLQGRKCPLLPRDTTEGAIRLPNQR